MIPFSPPRIDKKITDKVTEVLQSGWITTGPVTKEFERELASYLGISKVLCLNSWTNAAELFLRWYGIKAGDEVLVPAYTYAASCNIIFHLGATPILVDCEKDYFQLCLKDLESKITDRTKVIMPVDIGGLPCKYEEIAQIISAKKHLFTAHSEAQEKLGRILLFSDAAHSLGARINGKHAAHYSDVTCYSFHAVKNLTTAEGGAIAFNLPESLDAEEIYRDLNILSLHGQTKDALSKTTSGSWKYDIITAGYKCNMTDIQAAIGSIELGRYENDTLVKRKAICNAYDEGFKSYDWAILPSHSYQNSSSSYHLYQLRIKDFGESERDQLMQKLKENGVSSNVHFMPLPSFSFYQSKGYSNSDYPEAFKMYENEISLPVFYNISDAQLQKVISEVISAVETLKNA